MAIRQIIYTLVYFLSQKNLRAYTVKVFKCQTCKKAQKKVKIDDKIEYTVEKEMGVEIVGDVKVKLLVIIFLVAFCVEAS